MTVSIKVLTEPLKRFYYSKGWNLFIYIYSTLIDKYLCSIYAI